ncbi:Hypothetical predicted protein [Mytilus galloprovincialis]|uniref:Uncharacterized protein n=1 Tax=Mytilus galloprovincialis TaxID=29158 RepID=A0A8B6GRR7_MYTGA|nr:Hypothetical predicted protein [Mytilus galloprovincialis]
MRTPFWESTTFLAGRLSKTLPYLPQYATKRDKESKQKSNTNITNHTATSNSEGYKTSDAFRKAVYRAKQQLPTSPKQFATVLSGLAVKATLRKRKALNEEGILLTPSKRRRLNLYDKSYSRNIEELKNKSTKRKKGALKRRRILASAIVWSRTAKEVSKMGLSWEFAFRASKLEGVWDRQNRSDKLDKETI